METPGVDAIPGDPSTNPPTPEIPAVPPVYEQDSNGEDVIEIDPTSPVHEETDHIRWRIVRQDDAAHFTLNGDDVKSLQFRVVTPEEHSLKWLVDNFYIDEDADLNLEMWFVYERYTPQQQQPQHNANHFVGYYKSAITDQHGV